MKPIGIVILGLFLMVPCAALSHDREAAVRTAIQSFYKASMMVSWARPTTRLRTGTTSILSEVVIGADYTPPIGTWSLHPNPPQICPLSDIGAQPFRGIE
jgi:hypothetical protein